MKVLIVETGYSPYEADIENTPASLTAVLESEKYNAAFPFDNTVIAAVYGGDAEKPDNRTLGSIGLGQGRFIVCGSRRAVSYTHLDVYKRQAYGKAAGCCRRSMYSPPAADSWTRTQRIQARDVYKRQG